eukprot:2940732-Prymnesium_polylepis.1
MPYIVAIVREINHSEYYSNSSRGPQPSPAAPLFRAPARASVPTDRAPPRTSNPHYNTAPKSLKIAFSSLYSAQESFRSQFCSIFGVFMTRTWILGATFRASGHVTHGFSIFPIVRGQRDQNQRSNILPIVSEAVRPSCYGCDTCGHV